MEDGILNDLDTIVNKKHFSNRSQAIRHLITNNKVSDEWEDNKEVAGAIVLVYDHHRPNLQKKSTDIQHDFHHLILAVQHVHLDHHNCLETIALRGKADELRTLSDRLIAIKGIKHGKLLTSIID